jgi:hypothetical protein
MKKINKIALIAGVVSTSLLWSCKKDFLELKPYTDIPAGDAVNSPANMKSALNGAYRTMMGVNLYGRTIPVFGDLLGDNVFVSAANSGRYIAEKNYSFTVTDGDISGIWNSSYSAILRANNIINSELNTDEVKQVKGEAYALRALNYFNLVRLYAKPYTDDPKSLGVPLVLTYNPSLLPARNTVEEVYTQILSDLDQAYSLMSEYRGTTYFSKYAARALAAKVNLYKGEYQNAYDYANDVITNGGFSLVTAGGLKGYFAVQDPPTGQVETLFEVASDPVNNLSFDELVNIYAQTYPNNGSTYGDLLTTKTLYDQYSATDVRKALITTGKRDRPAGEASAFFVNKYPNASGNYGLKKVIRLSEVYLIAAEAGARLGKADAVTKLNTLMAQRDPSKVYTSSGTQLVNDVIAERRKELAFEGDRFFDLNRLKATIERGSDYPTGPIPYGSNKRVLPIPQSELNVNPNIVQNPL